MTERERSLVILLGVGLVAGILEMLHAPRWLECPLLLAAVLLSPPDRRPRSPEETPFNIGRRGSSR